MPLSKKTRKVVALSSGAILLLALGIVAGFFIAKYSGSGQVSTGNNGNDSGSSVMLPVGYQRGMPIDAKNILQLPQPGSPEAQDLQSRSDTAWSASMLYQLSTDADAITEQLTQAFLEQMWTQLAANTPNGQNPANGGDTTGLTMSLLGPGTNETQVLQILVSVAKDILSYFRYHRSQALLPLLRQFSERGSLALADVDPDALRTEIQDLLNVTTMGRWYADVSNYDVSTLIMTPAGGSSASNQAGAAQLLVGSGAPSGRRLLQPHHTSLGLQHTHYGHFPFNPLSPGRHLRAAAIPDISDAAAAAEQTIPTADPQQSLEDMLCAVEPFSPSGLKGISLPNGTNAGPITCKKPPTGIYKDGAKVFKPVVIPVVFHCQRYVDENNVLQPPIWDAEASGKNLIDWTNKLYKGTGIQFKLQEVRSDVGKYPYLLLSSLSDWQSCSGNPNQEAAGFPCLKDTAKFPDVSALAEDLVINVLVGGSQITPFCNGTDAEVCTSLYLGYCSAMGPWFMQASPTWREGLSEENWVVVTWDMFAPTVKNAWRFWNGGAVTVAHELGHYLGLMHTHEGATPCEGDGLTKADAVPDTPVNLQTEQWAYQNGLAMQLAKWCAEFRNSKSPSSRDLLQFNSCKKVNTVDNVFNIMSYVPDACCMIFTENQVARLQWAITNFRPKLMAKFAA